MRTCSYPKLWGSCFLFTLSLCKFLSPFLLQAQESSIVLGEPPYPFSNFTLQNTELFPGQRPLVILKRYIPQQDQHTWFLLPFDHAEEKEQDETGNFHLINGQFMLVPKSTDSFLKAGLFKLGPLNFGLHQETNISPSLLTQGFSFAFETYFETLLDDQIVFQYSGSYRWNGQIYVQKILIYVQNRRMNFEFTNVFIDQLGEPTSFQLQGPVPLETRVWEHHNLSYNPKKNYIIYAKDGIPQHFQATKIGNKIYEPYLGKAFKSTIVVGHNFYGLLDNFIAASIPKEDFVYHRYLPLFTGTLISPIIDLGYFSSQISQVIVNSKLPPGTSVKTSYRFDDTLHPLNTDEATQNPNLLLDKFKPLPQDGVFPFYETGRYLQLHIELFPDGYGLDTPAISSIEIRFFPNIPPSPPKNLSFDPDQLRLSWEPSNYKTEGYRLYIGTTPNNYSTTPSIDLGKLLNYQLKLPTGLYYLALASYMSQENQTVIIGPLSDEITVRIP